MLLIERQIKDNKYVYDGQMIAGDNYGTQFPTFVFQLLSLKISARFKAYCLKKMPYNYRL